MSLRLVIKKTVGGAPFSVNVDPDITISDLKAEVSRQAAIPAEEQRLIYKGQVRFLMTRMTPCLSSAVATFLLRCVSCGADPQG